MTKKEVVAFWRESVLPYVREQYEADGVPDYPARREAWNDMVDGMARDGAVTERQASTWTHPPENSPRPRRWRLSFYGRQVGAIGRCSHFQTTVRAASYEEARLALYERFEHIGQVSLVGRVR